MDFWAGRYWRMSENFSGDLRLSQYTYPDDPRRVSYNRTELTAHAGLSQPAVSRGYLFAQYQGGRLFAGYAEGNAWAVEISGRHPLNERFSISAGFGHYGLDEIYHDSYNYWNVTLTATFKPFELQLAYLGVDESAKEHFADDSVGDRVALTALWRFSSDQLAAREPGRGPGGTHGQQVSERLAAVALKSVEIPSPAGTWSRSRMPPNASCSSASPRSRDQAAFRTLYGNYYQRLSRLLARMSVRREDIEEVINDTFWVVWTKAGEFRGASQLSTWIIGIAYRRALNALRRAKIRPVSDEPFDEDSVSVASTDEAETDSQWLALGLSRLPVEQRMALELTYTLGHSCEEVAAILDCPVNTVKTRLFRARETLKQVLPALAGMSGENS